MAWLYVAATLTLTTAGQFLVKWQVDEAGALPGDTAGKLEHLFRLVLNPWILLAFAGTAVAALCWMAALSHFELSRAYPFASLSFVAVLLGSAVFFGEQITVLKVVGVLLVFAGLAVGSQG